MLGREKESSLHHSLLVECLGNETSFPLRKWRKRKVYQGPCEMQSSEENIFRHRLLKYTSYSRSDPIHYVVSNLKVNKSQWFSEFKVGDG